MEQYTDEELFEMARELDGSVWTHEDLAAELARRLEIRNDELRDSTGGY